METYHHHLAKSKIYPTVCMVDLVPSKAIRIQPSSPPASSVLSDSSEGFCVLGRGERVALPDEELARGGICCRSTGVLFRFGDRVPAWSVPNVIWATIRT